MTFASRVGNGLVRRNRTATRCFPGYLRALYPLAGLILALGVSWACTATAPTTPMLADLKPTDTLTATPTVQGPPAPLPTDSPTAAPTAPGGLMEPAPTALALPVARGLEVPWSLAFAPDGRLFFTERPGRVRVIEDGELVPEPWARIRAAPRGEGGLLGLALDPDFSRTGYVYVYYTHRDGAGRLVNRVSRLREVEGMGGDEEVLLDGIPGARNHNGGRLRFGPDGWLYITTGDAGDGPLAQDPGSLAGKILRLDPNGHIPGDNPFPGSPVYSYGHRNPQGLDWHPETGTMVATEHGPSAHDEVNVIVPGGNYGWPLVSGEGRDPGSIGPLRQTGRETWAPSGASFYTGGLFTEWRGDFFLAALRGNHLRRLRLDGPAGGVIEEEVLFSGELGRLRDVVVGPGGALYLATNNWDGRGSPAADDDRILRVVPQVPGPMAPALPAGLP